MINRVVKQCRAVHKCKETQSIWWLTCAACPKLKQQSTNVCNELTSPDVARSSGIYRSTKLASLLDQRLSPMDTAVAQLSLKPNKTVRSGRMGYGSNRYTKIESIRFAAWNCLPSCCVPRLQRNRYTRPARVQDAQANVSCAVFLIASSGRGCFVHASHTYPRPRKGYWSYKT